MADDNYDRAQLRALGERLSRDEKALVEQAMQQAKEQLQARRDCARHEFERVERTEITRHSHRCVACGWEARPGEVEIYYQGREHEYEFVRYLVMRLNGGDPETGEEDIDVYREDFERGDW